MKLFKKTNKKGQVGFGGVINGLILATLGIIILGLVLTYSADIVQDEHDDFNVVNNASAATNSSDSTLDALTEVSDRLDTLGTIIIVGAIITVLLAVFGGLLIQRYVRG